MAAVENAKPGIKHIDSAVRYSEFAATATVPNVATVLVVIIPAEDMAILSKAAGRLMRKTVFKIAQSGIYSPLMLSCMGPFFKKSTASIISAPMVADPEVAAAAPATPQPAPIIVNSIPNSDIVLVG